VILAMDIENELNKEKKLVLGFIKFAIQRVRQKLKIDLFAVSSLIPNLGS
jgi:hypothetical protein